MRSKFLVVFCCAIFLVGCRSAGYHKRKVQDDSADRLTVGTVQREIRIGMSSAEVAEVLGSPNVVSTDEERREVWIYDKISSDVSYSNTSGYGTLILIGSVGKAGAVSKTQRTLTVIVKFDLDGKVRDFAYHTSRF